MIIHVGTEPGAGKLSYYNDAKKSEGHVVMNKVHNDEIDKVSLMFDQIKSKIDAKELGNLCICLHPRYSNEIRKKFVEEGLKYGFKNVEIINTATAFYLYAIPKVNYKPVNGNVIWIEYWGAFDIWVVNDRKAKCLCAREKLTDSIKLLIESKLNIKPDALFYTEKFDKALLNQISASQNFIYDTYLRCYAKASLLKARITAGDFDLTYLAVNDFLSRKLTLKNGEEEIVSFERCQQLPLNFSRKLYEKSSNDTLEIITEDGQLESLILPKNNKIYLSFEMNTNEIYFINFKEQPFFKNPGSSSAKDYTIPKITASLNDTKINAIGIDLGTSRCCAAVIRKNGITTVALDNNGERLLPSYVSYDGENVKCGKIVVERLRNYSKSTIFDSKRIIGRSLSDIEIDIFWPFGIFEINSKVYLEVEKFSGKATVFVEEVAAELLKHIKQKAEEFQGKPLSKAVITVPAAFNEAQKNATLEAAMIAGWKEIILLPEPVAAAFAYFNDRPISNNTNVLLFDLGGGTLDVCIFKIQNNQIEIISNTGDSKFGGRDFDTVLINHFKNALSTKYGISFEKKKKYLLMVKCQKIKETLSFMVNASLDVDDFDTNQEGNIQISQEGFQKMCELLLKRVKNTLNAALHNSNFNANQINKVLHVGGGSRTPMIKQLLLEMFPQSEHICEEHPDEVVAIGAAYYAYSIFSE